MKTKICIILLTVVILSCAYRIKPFINFFNDTSSKISTELNIDLLEASESKSNAETEQVENYDVLTKSYDYIDDSKQINIKILYPQIAGMADQKLEKNVNTIIKEAALNPYNEIVKIDNGIEQGTSWSVDYVIEYATDTVISIKFGGYIYMQGNAHGIDRVYSANIDLTSGKKITISDIFNSSFKEKLDSRYFKGIDVDTTEAEESALKKIFDEHKKDFETSENNFYFTSDQFIILLPLGNYYRFGSNYEDLKSAMIEDNLIWNSILDNR
ncbi:DUF4163 domain-containing protein [Clostridium sp. HBUAS56010]|uniref:PdaC/SigV domain-containing protein n=1 Tax=Clostridium sp. HBUAS56010 TaxID=2571127 RepID=UPI0011779082|nr:DUF4163 domain-containing protein [Clostridium sp. HBUAS56010]